MTPKIYRRRSVPLKVAPGVEFWMRQEAGKMGLTLSEWTLSCFDLEPGERGMLRLVVRQPSPAHIAVVGTCGHIVGTLADVLLGNVAIDESDFPTDRSRIACRQEIMVEHTDLERDADGKLTGRLSPKRRQRRPGRNKSVQAERARTLLAQRPDLTGEGASS